MRSAPTILLADDDEVGRYVIATMLRRSGFTVTEVADGLSAVSAALAAPPDLAVLDVKMPGLDGFEACRRIKSHDDTKHIPVLMLSATFMAVLFVPLFFRLVTRERKKPAEMRRVTEPA